MRGDRNIRKSTRAVNFNYKFVTEKTISMRKGTFGRYRIRDGYGYNFSELQYPRDGTNHKDLHVARKHGPYT